MLVENKAVSIAVAIVTTSLAVGDTVRKAGLGAQVLQFGVGFFGYTRLIAASPIQNNLAQYVCALAANNMAGQAVSATCMGISIGAVANVALAVVTVVTVATVLQAGYNNLMAEKGEERVNVSLGSLVSAKLKGVAA